MNTDLTGRTAVVTGGSKGIGLAIVGQLIEAGARVVTGARSMSPEIEELVRNNQVTFREVDLAHHQGPDQLVAAAGDRIDILVNNVGAARPGPGGFLSATRRPTSPAPTSPSTAASSRRCRPTAAAEPTGCRSVVTHGEHRAARP
jgi:NAD(P)-dependent dehydrogenase (short-subunit alcohol dehydrogenase family)